jgi:putative lipoprotein
VIRINRNPRRARTSGPVRIWLAWPLVLLLAACGGDAPATVASEMAVMEGVVVLEPRAPLRRDATITVRLVDVSRADAPAMLLAQQQIAAKGQPVPVPFRLEYDPEKVSERNRYALRAEIRDAGGTVLWTSTTHHPVLGADAPAGPIEVRVEPLTRPH